MNLVDADVSFNSGSQEINVVKNCLHSSLLNNYNNTSFLVIYQTSTRSQAADFFTIYCIEQQKYHSFYAMNKTFHKLHRMIDA